MKNNKYIKQIDELGRITIPFRLLKEVCKNEYYEKYFTIEKVYSADTKTWGFIILPIDQEE